MKIQTNLEQQFMICKGNTESVKNSRPWYRYIFIYIYI